MANPRHRHTPSRRDKRRANWFKVATPTFVECPECKEPKLPHRVCPNCGTYKGRKFLEVEE
ncbi:large subunit ribosomal protein L32 [Thermodesulfovibrio aggregans]|uniref:Large ribosomal subunit protein bL32 n=1 Tax=Thermodesulfovibrio aggregans TaxID=86166 RepID=A0A0U9HRV1_9BACT|nr:50S ribosomal protein L32 [Thermodesulfovibrio aggregans]GAQ95739.1 large subunit ribosomal protein L32 [Thermodesulfovibrio aggregans]